MQQAALHVCIQCMLVGHWCSSTHGILPRCASSAQEAVAAKSWLAAKSIQLGKGAEQEELLNQPPCPCAAVHVRKPSCKGATGIPGIFLSPCAGTLAVVAAMSQTWLHPLLKKVLPAQGEVSVRGEAWVGRHEACTAALLCGPLMGSVETCPAAVWHVVAAECRVWFGCSECHTPCCRAPAAT